MATSTLIQSLDLTYSDGISTGVTPSNRSQEETFISSGVISVGDWVAFDATAPGAGKVVVVNRAAVIAIGNPLVVGVAKTAATAAGQKVKVVVSGFATAWCAGGIVAGTPLAAAEAVAGQAGIADATTVVVAGVALGTPDAAGQTAVWVYKKL